MAKTLTLIPEWSAPAVPLSPAMPDFAHDVAANEYGFYCVPRAFAGRQVPRALALGTVHEAATLALMRRRAGSGDIVSGGAFIGDFLPPLSQALAAGCRLHSFEPNPVSRAAAQATIGLNGLDNVTLHPVAVGQAPDTLHLKVRRGREEAGGLSRIVDGPRGDATIPVQVARLDDLVPRGRAVSILHLDVEGHEWPAILGARRIIEESRPMLVLEAGRPRRQRQLRGWLAQAFPRHGYRLAGTLDKNAIYLPLGPVPVA